MEQANSVKNKQNYLEELMDNNYKDLSTIRSKTLKSPEIKLEKFDSEIDEEVIKTETPNFEYVDVQNFDTNCLSDIKKESVDIESDSQDDVVSAEETDEPDNHTITNKSNLFKCKNCHLNFDSLIYLEEHTQRCDKNIKNTQNKAVTGPIFKCDFCPTAFSSLIYYGKHLKYCRRRGDNVIRGTTDSSIQSRNSSEISRPKPTSQQIGQKGIAKCEKRYKCEVCSKSFNQSSLLRTHNRIHTGEKPYECDICNKRFHQLGNLHVHKRIHTGEKPYKCDICNKSFNRSGNLDLHKIIHTGEKPFECDVCSKSFKRIDILQSHKRIHTGEKPYVCDTCSKCFNNSGDLQKHKRIHTGEKPYVCDICCKRFSDTGNLYKHKLIHTSNKTL